VVDLFRYRHWDLVSKRGIYYTFSSLLILAGLICLITRGLNLGIDFKGGGLTTFTTTGHIPNNQIDDVIGSIRDGLKKAGVENDVVISSNSALAKPQDFIVITTRLPHDLQSDLDSQLLAMKPIVSSVVAKHHLSLAPGLNNVVGAPSSEDHVGNVISGELINQAILAIIIGSLLIFFWIWLRYNIGGFGWKYSAGGILALIHDLCITVGLFAILRDFLQVNSPFIAAFLTVLGYSIHDTIVIYDRIRENMRLRKGRTFAETVNISLLETMARSVNTVLTVMFTLLALFFFGGSTLRDFVAALLIGVTIGAYSSIFIASQLLVSWAKGKDRVVLPLGETLQTATVGVPMTSFSPSMSANIPAGMTPASEASREGIQRAKQAGKTSVKKRK